MQLLALGPLLKGPLFPWLLPADDTKQKCKLMIIKSKTGTVREAVGVTREPVGVLNESVEGEYLPCMIQKGHGYGVPGNYHPQAAGPKSRTESNARASSQSGLS